MTLERFEAVEIPVPSGSTLTRFYFNDLPNLRNAKITSIVVYTTDTISATPLSGATPVTIADLKKSFLTLYEGDLQLIYNIPMLSFNNFAQNATTSAAYVFQVPDVDGITISWVKSYVTLPTALATTGTTYSFGVYYHF
jgi:hypothetical protein